MLAVLRQRSLLLELLQPHQLDHSLRLPQLVLPLLILQDRLPR
jgi:hypothetical protein